MQLMKFVDFNFMIHSLDNPPHLEGKLLRNELTKWFAASLSVYYFYWSVVTMICACHILGARHGQDHLDLRS